MKNSEITVMTLLSAVAANTIRTTVRIARIQTSAFVSERSAALAPRKLPTNRPEPKRMSSHGTLDVAKPVTSVRVKAM